MKYLLWSILTFVAVSMFTSCVESLNDSYYKISCSIDKSLGTDSVSLFLLQDEYSGLYHVSTVALDKSKGVFLFEGQIESPQVAFLKFSNDSTPFYFVLEKGETVISISPNSTVVTAGNLNHEYLSFLKQRNRLLAAKNDVFKKYLSSVSPDSVIDVNTEKQFLAQDSLLADSLERITLEAINRGSMASVIIHERFVNQLRPEYLNKVYKKR